MILLKRVVVFLVLLLSLTTLGKAQSGIYAPAGLSKSDMQFWLDGSSSSNLSVTYVNTINVASSTGTTVTSVNSSTVVTSATVASQVSGGSWLYFSTLTDPKLYSVPGITVSSITSDASSSTVVMSVNVASFVTTGARVYTVTAGSLLVSGVSGNTITTNLPLSTLQPGTMLALASSAAAPSSSYTSDVLPGAAKLVEVSSVAADVSGGSIITLTTTPSGVSVGDKVFVGKVVTWADNSGNAKNYTHVVPTGTNTFYNVGFLRAPYYVNKKGVFFSAPVLSGGASFGEGSILAGPVLNAIDGSGGPGYWTILKQSYPTFFTGYTSVFNHTMLSSGLGWGSNGDYAMGLTGVTANGGSLYYSFSPRTSPSTVFSELQMTSGNTDAIFYSNFVPVNTTGTKDANDATYSNINGGTLRTTVSGAFSYVLPTGSFNNNSYLGGTLFSNNLNLLSTPYNGLMNEVISGRGKLSDSKRMLLEGYLAWKWGTVSKLSSSHPFYLASQPSGFTTGFVGIYRSTATDTVSYTRSNNGLILTATGAGGSFLSNNGDGMFAVDNSTSATASFSGTPALLNRTWYIERIAPTATAASATFSLVFDFNAMGLGTPNAESGFYRIHLNTTNGFSSSTAKSYVGTVSGNMVVFPVPAVAIATTGTYLTLEKDVPSFNVINNSAAICSGNNSFTFNFSNANSVTTKYNITWDAAALSDGLTNVSNGALTVNSGSGSIQVSNIPNNITNAEKVYTGRISPVNGVTSVAGEASTFTLTVNPIPQVTTVLPALTVCKGTLVSAIPLASSVSGTVFTWTSSNTAAGLAATGSGNIAAFTATNNGTSPIATLVTVTPYYTNSTPLTSTCVGTAVSFTVTVNPTPTVAAVSSATYCTGTTTSVINLTGTVPGTVFNWTNSNTSIGLAASQNGVTTIPSFVTTNATNLPIYGDLQATPSYTNLGTTCTGAPIAFSIITNPVVTVGALSDVTACANTQVAQISFNGAVTGTVFDWTSSNFALGGLSSANGVTSIPAFTAINAGAGQLTTTVTVTPRYTNAGVTCSGTPVSFTVTVNPLPVLTSSLNAGAICASGVLTYTATSSLSGTTFRWNRVLPAGLSSTEPISGTATVISQTLSSSSNAIKTAEYGFLLSTAACANPSVFTVTATVNPTPNLPTVNAGGNQTLCDGGTGALIGSYSTPGSTGGEFDRMYYTWRNIVSSSDQTGLNLGFGTVGSGEIPSFTAQQPNTFANSTGGFRVKGNVDYALGGGGTLTCSSIERAATIVVYPRPVLSSVTSTAVCSGAPLSLTMTTSTPNVSFTWSRSAVTNISNIAVSGNITSVISETLVNTSTSPIDVTYNVTITNLSSTGCVNNQTITVRVYPKPTLSSALTTSAVCSGTPFSYTPASGVSGTNFTWARNATAGITGTVSGTQTGSPVAETLTNSTVSAITVTYAITSTTAFCSAVSVVSVPVNPTPTVNTITDKTFCNNVTTSLIGFTGSVTGSVYTWSNTNSAIGLGTTGTGDISPFTATNATAAAISGSVNVVPSFTNAGTTCSGSSKTFVITVDPTPQLQGTLASAICSGSNYSFSPSSNVSSPAVQYAWTRILPAGVTATGALTGTGNVPSQTLSTTNTDQADVTYRYVLGTSACANMNTFSVTVTVDPVPVASAVSDLVVCNGATSSAVTFASSTISGSTFYNWSRLSPTSLGILQSQSAVQSFPSFIAQNNSSVPVTGQISVTPYFQNAGALSNTCLGSPIAFSVTVNPAPAVNLVTGAAFCANLSSSVIQFSSGVAGVTMAYDWVNDNAATGLAALTGSTDNIPSFATTNSTNHPIYSHITVTPRIVSGGLTTTCSGSTMSFTITVNPVPVVDLVADRVVCNNALPTAISFAGNITETGLVYKWTNNLTSIGLGATGTGAIGFTAVNSGTGPVTAGLTVTPEFTNITDPVTVSCSGASRQFSITVNPTPDINTLTAQTICSGTESLPIALTGSVAGSVFDWQQVSGTGNLLGSASWVTGVTSIGALSGVNNGTVTAQGVLTVVPRFVNLGTTCLGTARSVTITINPVPEMADVSNVVYCNAVSTTQVAFSSNITGVGIGYDWTNNLPSINLAASGSGNIPSFSIANISTAPVSATISVTPKFTNATAPLKTCVGSSKQFTISVNPTPTVSTVGLSNTVVCGASSISAQTLSGTVPGTQYKWTNTNTAIGLGASDVNTIPAFTATNNQADPLTGVITIVPEFTALGATCQGTAFAYSVTVNPVPVVTNTLVSKDVCSTYPVNAVVLSSSANGANIAWTNSNTAIGLAASGTATIPSFVASNAGSLPIAGNILVSPSFSNGGVTCVGASVPFTVTVNPTPLISSGTVTATICSGGSFSYTPASLTPGTQFTWSRPFVTGINNAAASGSDGVTESLSLNSAITQPTAAVYSYVLSANGCTSNANVPVVINPLPKLSGVAQAAGICGGNLATINLTGVIPNSTFSITYKINNDLKPDVIGITANGLGAAQFSIPLANIDNGRQLIVTDMRRTDLPLACYSPFTSSNSGSLSVSAAPTLAGVTQSEAVCSGSTATIILAGMLANSTSTIDFSINGVSQQVTGVITGSGGDAAFPVQLTSDMNGISLTVNRITRTDNSGNCFTDFVTSNSVLLRVDRPSFGGTVSGNVVVCAGAGNAATLTLSGQVGQVLKWQSSADNFLGDVLDVESSNATLNVTGATETRQYRAVVQNGRCLSVASGSATITTVNQPSASLTQAAQVVCVNSTPSTVGINTSGGVGTVSYQWYQNTTNSNTGGVSLGNANGAQTSNLQPVAPSAAGGVYYYAIASFAGSGCVPAVTPVHTVTVNRYAVAADLAVTPASPEICSGLGTNLTVSVANPGDIVNPTFEWYADAGLTTRVAVGTAYTTPALFANTSYFIKVSGDNICSNQPGFAKEVIVRVNNIAPEVDQPLDQIVCRGQLTNPVVFTGGPVGNTIYRWTNSNTGLGLSVSSGTGDIASFLTANGSGDVLSTTISVTPQVLTTGCFGVTKSFVIKVTPDINPGDQKVESCSGELNFSYTPTGAPTGTLYTWTVVQPNAGIVGAGDNLVPKTSIDLSLINTTTADADVVYRVIPTGIGACAGTPFLLTVTVKKIPIVNAQSAVTCSEVAFNALSNAFPGITYTWGTPATLSGSISGSSSQSVKQSSVSQTLVNNGADVAQVRYTVTPFNGRCNGSSFNLVVTVNPKPVLQSATSLVVCNKVATSYTPQSATAATAFKWGRVALNGISNAAVANQAGAITETLENTTTDPVLVTYNFVLTANGCENRQDVSVTVNPTLKLNSATTVASCSGTLFNYTPSSATAGVGFKWTRSLVSGIRNNANNGSNDIFEALLNETSAPINVTYNFDLSLNNTCNNTQTVTVAVNPIPTVSPIASQVICNNTNAVIGIGGSAVAGTVYKWTNNNFAVGLGSSGTGNISFTGSNSGTQPVLAAISVTPEANGCSGLPANFTITVNPAPVLSSSTNISPVCSNAPFVYVPTSATSGTVVTWRRDVVNGIANAAATGTGIIRETLINNANSPIQVPYVIVLSANGCQSTQTINVIVNPTPTVENPGDQVACNGSVKILTFGGSLVNNTSYRWVNDNTSIGLAAAGTEGLFFSAVNSQVDSVVASVTVTPVANGCAGAPVTFALKVNPVLQLTSVTSPSPICSNSSFDYVPLAKSNGTSFAWSRAAVSGISNLPSSGVGEIHEVLVNTTANPILVSYEYVLTNNGCTSRQTVIVQVNPVLTLANQNAAISICSGESFSYTPVSNVSGIQYQWSRSSIAGISNPAASATGAISEALVNTTDTLINVLYKLTLGVGTACSNDQQVVVGVRPLPRLTSASSVTVCSGAPVAYVPAANLSGTNLFWSRANVSGLANPAATGTGNIGESLFNTQSFAVSTDYTYQLLAANGCSNSQKISVTVSPLPTVSSVADQSVCAGNIVPAISFSSPFPNATFTWFNTDPSIGLAATGTGSIAPFTAVNNSSGPLIGSIQVTPVVNGCQGSPVIVTRITVNRPLNASFVESYPAVACPAVNVNGFVAGVPLGGDGYNYAFQWQSSSDGVLFTNLAGATSRQMNAPPISGDTYFRMSTLSGGCATVTPAVKVLLKSKPVVTIANNDNYTVSIGNSTQVFVTGGVSYLWSPTTFISDPQSASPFLSPQTDTKYTVRVTNADGCSLDTAVQIKVITGFEIYPNIVLTPNGDGINDVWKIKNIEFYPQNKISLYNTNGVKVKEWDGYKGDWDGKINGVKLASGTYYFNILLKPGETAVKKGFLTIL